MDVQMEFDVYCGLCGAHLCGQTETHKHHNGLPYISVRPCPRCIQRAVEAALPKTKTAKLPPPDVRAMDGIDIDLRKRRRDAGVAE